MQIHVVRQGQSLFEIANVYGVTVNEIATANQLNPSNSLVIGQALVIPITGQYYFVVSGDSLDSIGRRFGVSSARLAEINDINIGSSLLVGQRLYIPAVPKTQIESNGYAEAQNGEFSADTLSAVRENSPFLTYLSAFSYQVKRDGTLVTFSVSPLQTAATGSGASLVMVVSNIEDGAFSDTLGHEILSNPQVQNTLINNIIETAKANGFRDVHFDFEFLKPEDRELYNAFLRNASTKLHNENLLMSTALAPKTSSSQSGAWYTAHDYKVHGEVADFVVIMTYEWGYSGGPPMAVSPIGPVRRVLEYAKTEIPSNKIMMGQNLYGYDWTLPFVQGGQSARAVSPQTAIALARNNRARIEYDPVSQAPFFNYWDRNGTQHVVWFEDARSINAKFDLLKELDLRGISYWKLGLDFPQNWLLLNDRFRINKR